MALSPIPFAGFPNIYCPYNGRQGTFKATISTARNLTSPIRPINQPVNGAAAFSSVKNISVADGEAPFAGVCDAIRKQKGASSKGKDIMSHGKIVKGIVSCTQVKENTRVVIDHKFSILVPKGMLFSTNKNEIGTDRLFAMFSPVPASVQLDDDSFDEQYTFTPVRLHIKETPFQINGHLNLNGANERKKVEGVLMNLLQRTSSLSAILTGGSSNEPPFVVKSDAKAVVVAVSQGLAGAAAFYFATSSGLFTGVYRVLKDVELVEPAAPAVYKKTAMELLSTIESFEEYPDSSVSDIPLPASSITNNVQPTPADTTANADMQENKKNSSGNPTEKHLPQNAVVTNIGPALSEDEKQWLIKQKAQKDRDAQGRALARDIRSQSNNNYKKFIRRRNEQHSIMLDKQYDFLPAEELQEDLSAFQNIIDEYGGAEESLIRDGLTKLTKMKSILSAEVIIDIIEAIYSVFFSANVAPTLFTYPKACLYTYHWTIDISTIKKFLLNARKNLKRVDSQEKAEREKEEAELKEAKKYGISVSELHIRHKYMEAKEGMSKARTSKDYTALAEDFAALNGYKDSKKLMEECRKKASSREYAERQAKDFLQEWQLACEKVKAERINRQDALQKELNAVYNEKLVAWEKEQADKLSQCAKKRDDLSKKAQQIQKELNSAGFLSFLKKQKLKAELVQVRIDQSNAKKEESDTIALYNKEKKDLQDAHAKDLSALQQRIERELPMPFKNIKVSAAEDIVKELEKSSR